MHKLKNDKALETYKIFPYVAWGITLFFSYFVYTITMELKETVDTLKIQTEHLQYTVNTPVHDVASFEK